MVVGNVVALAQRSLKRMLAYSSIAHAGYLLVGVWTGTDLGRAAVLLYLIAYSITSLAAFGIITAVERVGSRTVMLEDVEGFFRVRPWGRAVAWASACCRCSASPAPSGSSASGT